MPKAPPSHHRIRSEAHMRRTTFVIFFTGVALFVFVIGYGFFGELGKANAGDRKQGTVRIGQNMPMSAAGVGQAVMEKPKNGAVQYYSSESAVAPFSLVTPEGEDYYYVLFRDVETNKAVASMFVYPGSTREMKMPLGSFVMYCAQGKEWYGPEKLFGLGTKLMKSEMAMNFVQDSEGFVGHTEWLQRLLHLVPEVQPARREW